MRLVHGGFTPKIAGRPARDVVDVRVPNRLTIDLIRGGITYAPTVRSGSTVRFGEPIAKADAAGGTLSLPAPAGGKVTLVESDDITQVVIEPGSGPSDGAPGNVAAGPAAGFEPKRPERVSREEVVQTLARGGAWPFLWSSRTRGLPQMDSGEGPRAIIVNFVLTEPYRARGRVIVTRSWQRIVEGIRFLQRLSADYGTIQVVLTSPDDPVAQMMFKDLAGHALVRIHSVPLTYPMENPQILVDALRREEPKLFRQDEVWVVDAQGVAAIGACLAEGLPVHERVVVTGGPGQPAPRHYAVRIGTPVSDFGKAGDDVRMLRGGLLNGTLVDPASASVGFDDDAFFYLPMVAKRESLGLIRPGFNRTSYNRSFASRLTGARDTHITATLRGEPRPCIACGLCENVCPVGIMPQVIHRYLHRDMTEEAAKSGLDLCVDCNLCTYVCPSKLELGRQFIQAKQQIAREREEMRAVEARASRTATTEEAK